MAPQKSNCDGRADAGKTTYPETQPIRSLPSEMRPREEVMRRGVGGVADEVLLAVLLRSGTRGRNVIELSRELLLRGGGLAALAGSSFYEIKPLRLRGLCRVTSGAFAAAL